jgi:hypothetical protein
VCCILVPGFLFFGCSSDLRVSPLSFNNGEPIFNLTLLSRCWPLLRVLLFPICLKRFNRFGTSASQWLDDLALSPHSGSLIRRFRLTVAHRFDTFASLCFSDSGLSPHRASAIRRFHLIVVRQFDAFASQ